MEPDEEDPEFRRFMQLDVKLRLLEKWPDIRKEFDVVREEYPDSYKFVKDYIKLLNNTADINRLREKLLKDYNRYAVYYEGIPPYYEEYPQRQPKTGEIQWDSDENGAYRRTNKKIGRNDPCPCGSGKKFFCLLPNQFRYAMINKSIFSNYLNLCNCPVFSTVTAKSQFIYRS